MLTKAQHTKQYILETVAPIFSKNGYAATSMSDLTSATGLTKGALYGNFRNKEDLAIAAFKHNVKKLMDLLRTYVSKGKTPIEKIYLVVDFYRNYYNLSKSYGGCPLLNIGVDSNNQNSKLLKKVRVVIQIIQDDLASTINKGIKIGEIHSNINAIDYAKRIDSMIQGAIFMTYTMDDDFYLKDTMDQIDLIIKNELKA
ncbi:TetR/AcrR family transcriptional regulator [Winogradskyella sp. PE311]|uniref:TetR/AcrR family transcriptional regulator n=1 Tax=Winogradskyella sp. PE311 TaxID=3366943 RepID=UPI00397EC238